MKYDSLYDIVDKLVGGGIQPIGETNYDRKAYDRQIEIQRLADYLIDDIFRITEVKGNESSIETARNKAFKWFNELIEMLEDNFDLKTVRAEFLKETEWIPVSERLPEDKHAVLVYCPEYKNNYCAYYENNQWWIFGAFVQLVPNAVVAWMSLPLPYKSEKGGE